MLAATSLVEKADHDTYVARSSRRYLCPPSTVAWNRRLFIKHTFYKENIHIAHWNFVPSKFKTTRSLSVYFAASSYRSPSDANTGSIQYAAWLTDLHYFD
jgi:hypothetical protein